MQIIHFTVKNDSWATKWCKIREGTKYFYGKYNFYEDSHTILQHHPIVIVISQLLKWFMVSYPEFLMKCFLRGFSLDLSVVLVIKQRKSPPHFYTRSLILCEDAQQQTMATSSLVVIGGTTQPSLMLMNSAITLLGTP